MNEPFWMLLPPTLRDRLTAKTDDRGLLPINMTEAVMKRLRAMPKRQRELWEMAQRIFDHLEAELPGWGEWPQDMGEAIFVGICLGAIVEQEADRLVCKLAPEELSDMEETCRTEGVSTEEYLLRLIVQRKESEEND